MEPCSECDKNCKHQCRVCKKHICFNCRIQHTWMGNIYFICHKCSVWDLQQKIIKESVKVKPFNPALI